MRILFLSLALPGPEANGYVVRDRELLGRFVNMGEVDVLSYAHGETPAAIKSSLHSQTTFKRPPAERPSLLTKAREALSSYGIFHSYEEFSGAIREHCERTEYDVIWLRCWEMIQYAPAVRAHAPRAKIVADATDDDIRSYSLDRAKSTSMIERLYLWRQIFRRERFERRVLPYVDATVFVSEVDAGLAQERHPGHRIEVLQHGVDTDAFRPADKIVDGSNGIVESSAVTDRPIMAFEGTMSFAPNVEGAIHFAKNIFPLVLKHIPEARAVIIGRSPVPSVRALESESLEVTGTVDDVREAVLRASIFVCPLLGGVGQKNKILQAWSLGMPIVSTSISVAGLEARDGDNLIIADTPEEFADACVRLLRDSQERQRLGANARTTALTTYSLRVKMDLVEKFLHELLDGPLVEVTIPSAAKHGVTEESQPATTKQSQPNNEANV